MTFFAKRANGQAAPLAQAGDGQVVAAPDAVAALPPGAGMADAMMRKMLGVGLSDLQGIAEQAGEMLAQFDRRLAAIESQQTEILARLTYLAARGEIGRKHDDGA